MEPFELNFSGQQTCLSGIFYEKTLIFAKNTQDGEQK